jgi:hypothetical protein
MESTYEGELDIPALPPEARRAHIVPALLNNNSSLVSIGQLADAGCDVQFNKTSATVTYEGNTIFTGTRNATNKLWSLTPTSDESSTATAHAAVGTATPAELVTFSHAALFSPALSTLEKALKKGFLINFPGLNEKTLRKYPPQSTAMIKGHMDQIRKNIQSTKTKIHHTAPTRTSTTQEPNDIDDCFPTDEISPDTEDHFFASTLDVPDATGKISTDQTGRFISPSSTGNNYILILYDYDSNAILAKAMPNRTATAILTAYKALHGDLVAAGRRPKLQRLDNECSEPLKQFFVSENITYQLVPPGVHRRNPAERAIRTFKNHFIAGLCTADPKFPLHLWDRLLEQAVLTLNLLRSSRLNPTQSAWAQLNGQYNYNAHPIAPPGIKVLVHSKPDTRGTWAPHAIEGWYVGPALHSYRCYKCWIVETQSMRITDTVSWLPAKIPMPTPSSNDIIVAGIADIVHALHNPTVGSTIAPLTPRHVEALRTLTDILHSTASSSATSPPTTSPAENTLPTGTQPVTPPVAPVVLPLRVDNIITPHIADTLLPLRVEQATVTEPSPETYATETRHKKRRQRRTGTKHPNNNHNQYGYRPRQ